MEPRLVRRAAVKYHDWLTKQRKLQQTLFPSGINQSLRNLENKAAELARLTNMFAVCTTGRKQVCPWEAKKVYHGVTGTELHKQLASHVIPNICTDVSALVDHVRSQVSRTLDTSNFPPQTLGDVIREVEIVSNAWPDVEFRGGELSIAIEDVCLSHYDTILGEVIEVELGTFRVYLNLCDPTRDLTIEADGDHNSGEGLSHPHVSGRRLCTGEGDLAMADAICQGRLEDYFRIVEAILRTYNHDSPYGTGLAEWYADDYGLQWCEDHEEYHLADSMVYCPRCESSFCGHNDEGGKCSECHQWVCDSCSSICDGCDNRACDECMSDCDSCSSSFCESCLSTCSECDNHFCNSCLHVCEECGENICGMCGTMCESCGNMHCSECLTTICDECDNPVCDKCADECNECGQQVCKNCFGSTCDGCGEKHCEKCSTNHTCLLVGIDND